MLLTMHDAFAGRRIPNPLSSGPIRQGEGGTSWDADRMSGSASSFASGTPAGRTPEATDEDGRNGLHEHVFYGSRSASEPVQMMRPEQGSSTRSTSG